MTAAADRRMLLVHAHPDDETITNGATMARYAAEGARVVLVTCTRGEQGEILLPEFAHLAADRDGGLGQHRVGELAAAMEALGVADHRFLDELPGARAGRYEDSGMAWGPDGRAVPAPRTPPSAFALADVDEAAAPLAAVLREFRPQVLVTYDPGGGYGHPDHVQAHRVATRAVELARDGGPGGPAWDVPKVYWTVPAGEEHTTVVDGSAVVAVKAAALRAHATQVAVEGGAFAVGDQQAQPLTGRERFRLVSGPPAPPWDADGREQDLFAGL